MRLLIASDDAELGQRVRAVMTRNGLESPPGHSVPLDAAADRCAQLLPELVVIVLSPDSAAGLRALLETHNTNPSVRILVVGLTDSPKLILEALKQGADEFLDQEILEAELVGSLIRSKVREKQPSAQAQAGRVVALVGPSGGSGVSTLAANISIVLAQQHGECGLIDLHLAAGDLTSLLDVQPMYTLADLCDHLAHADQTLFEQVLVGHPSGVHLLAAPTRMSDARRVTSKGVRRAITLARARFANVIIDTGTVLAAEQLEALWQADEILLVLRLDFTSLRNTRRVIDALVELGIERNRMTLVANGCQQRKQLEVEQAETALAMKIAHHIPYAPAAVNGALNDGVAVVLQSSFAKISRSIRSLAISVNGVQHERSNGIRRLPQADGFWARLTKLVTADWQS